MKRHDKELHEAMKDREFAYGAFLYEMDNHEYAINWDGDDEVLGCFGLNYNKLVELDLVNVYNSARNEHMRKAHEEWDLI